STPRMSASDQRFIEGLTDLVARVLTALMAFSDALRRLEPHAVPSLRAELQPLAMALHDSLARFRAMPPPADLVPMAEQLSRAASAADKALQEFATGNSFSAALPHILDAMHEHCRAQALLYPLRRALSPIGAFFLERQVRARAAEFDPQPRPGIATGIMNVPGTDGPRGGFALYVPERYDPARRWPLLVALHGAGGTGQDFLWTWLVEARSRGVLLLAPTSIDGTWSLRDGVDVDAPALQAAIDYVRQRWQVDTARILLTGISDGASYTLLCGLRADMPFTALAPISGVLLPTNLSNGNLKRASGKRIYLVHGARDWMFPVGFARSANAALSGAGADITYREIPDLAHSYPREENARILEWFDPALALPKPS
ncbi:MAG: hypothetical protein AB7V27_13410, partial [Candidatus Binatia bacterium]